jgi:hypothetical protein
MFLEELRTFSSSGILPEITDGVGAMLWSLSMKMRVHAHECDEALLYGAFDVLEAHLDFDSLVYKWPHQGEINQGPCWAEYALSVMLQMCRYRQGCVALAKSESMLAALVKLAGASITGGKVRIKPETLAIEQALIDTVGRCLSGLDGKKWRDLRVAAVDKLSGMFSFFKSHRSTMSPTKLGEMVVTDLGKSTKQLLRFRQKIRKGEKTGLWKPVYVMERNIVHDPALQALGFIMPTSSAAKNGESTCFRCGKGGAKLRCNRCRNIVYCSKDCQKDDWLEEHKSSCIPLVLSTRRAKMGACH